MTTQVKDTDIIIMGYANLTVKEFLDHSFNADVIGWCNGYLLGFDIPNADFFDKSLFEKNIRYFKEVIFAKMTVYEPELKIRGMSVAVIDYSTSVYRNQLLNYLKSIKKDDIKC